MKTSNIKMTALALLSITALFASCDKDELDDIINTVTPTAKVIVVHASPDGPAVDLLVDNTKQGTLSYKAATAYLNINEGTRNIKVNAANTATSVINADLPFTANKSYTLFAIDSVSKISALRLEDDLTAPAAGTAHVRFVHLSPNAPAVDIVAGGSVITGFGDKAFKSFSNFTPLPAGTYNLDVNLANTTTTVLDVDNVVLSAGKIYTIYARGFVGGTGASALEAGTILHN